MSEPSRSRRPRVSVREVVESLDEPMRRRGLERRDPFMAEATADDHWVASWLRMPPDDQVRDAVWPDGESIKVGFYDGVHDILRGKMDDVDVLLVLGPPFGDVRGTFIRVLDGLDLVEENGVDGRFRPHDRDASGR